MNCSCSGSSTSSTSSIAAAIDATRVVAISEPMRAIAPNVLAAQPAAQSPVVVASLLELGPVGWVVLLGIASWYLLKGHK